MRPSYPRHAFFAALAAVFLGAVDLTVIATVLPSMVIDLGINTADVDRYIWVVTAYLLAYIVTIPIMGRISDLIGRRNTFELALVIFTLGSIWCALANDLTQLIIARTIQGIGGGALLPIAIALVSDLFSTGQRLTAIGFVSAVDTFGWVLGPIWGALVVHILSSRDNPWRWIFWLNVPLCIAVFFAIHFSVRDSDHLQRTPRYSFRQFDLPGMTLLLGGLIALNLGLSAGGEFGGSVGTGLRAFGGTPNPLASHTSVLIGVGLLFLILFALWEKRARFPTISPQLFHRPIFVAAILANVLIGAALIVAVVDIPVVTALLVTEDRVSSVSALLLTPFTITMAILALAGGILARRLGARMVMTVGLCAILFGYAMLWFELRDHQYLRMVPGLFVAGIGFGALIAPLITIALDETTTDTHGTAAGLIVVSRLLGMTFGMSALTAFGVHRLQTLTDRAEVIIQMPGETTADFLLRQNAFIQEVAIPLSVQVVRETFLIAGVIALVAILPIWRLTKLRQCSDK